MSWPLVLFFAGLVLILLEFLLPSLGALGAGAALCLLASVIWAFTIDSAFGINMLLAGVIGVPVVILVGMKLLPKGPLGRVLVNPGATFTDGAAIDPRDARLLGAEGVVESLLRPAGVASFDGRRVDVVSRGEAIEVGARVRVIELAGNRVVVSRAQPSA